MKNYDVKAPISSSLSGKASFFLARLIDYSLLYFVGILLSIFFFLYEERSFYLFYALCVPLLWLPMEAFFLKVLGTTVGRMIFKLSLSKENKRQISWKDAFKIACSIDDKKIESKERLQVGLGRKILGIALAVICLTGAFYSPSFSTKVMGVATSKEVEGWIQFNSAEGGFKVAFPADPKNEVKVLEAPESGRTFNYNEYVSHHPKSEVFYSVSYIDLPKKWGLVSSRTILKGVLNFLLDADPSLELVEKKLSYHNKLPALEFRFKQAGQELEGKLILVGSRLYKLTVLSPPVIDRSTVQHQQFLDSFDLLTKKA